MNEIKQTKQRTKKFPPIESIVYTDSFVDMRKDFGLVEAPRAHPRLLVTFLCIETELLLIVG